MRDALPHAAFIGFTGTTAQECGSFAEMLEQTIRRYQNRAIEAAQVIEELIQLAKQIDRKSTRLNSSHGKLSRMPSSA